MKKEYNFSKSIKNPYTKHLKKQITIKLDEAVINYFKEISSSIGISYQNLINFYLRDCALLNKKPNIKWRQSNNEIHQPNKILALKK